MLPIIIIVVFMGIIGGMGFMVYSKMKETDPTAGDTSIHDNITTAQEFLPFQDIQDGMVSLGGHRYRAYIEVSSINYHLRTNGEKEMIDASFQSFVNSLSNPSAIYIQTRRIDTSKMMNGLADDIRKSVEDFPMLAAYGNRYYEEMVQLTDHIGNNKQKKKFIIISFDEAGSLPNLSEQEKYEYAAKEIHNQAMMIVDALTPVGLKSTVLNTRGVAELIYSTYHKDNHSHIENIVNGEYMTLIVESEKNPLETMPDEGYLDWVLYETQTRIQEGLKKEQVDPFVRKQMEESLLILHSIREKHAGYYSQKDDISYDLKEREGAEPFKQASYNKQ